MECAPILITTLNRHVHFIRLIESLKRNTWAKYTPVYVALDYPPSEKYMDGYTKISEYLNGCFDEFYEFNVIRRRTNYGSARNMAELREYILGRYDRFIRTDDDAEYAPNFLEYMNKCLDEYDSDENIIAIAGYSYPLNWNVTDHATVFKESFICPMWGTGFWTSKFRKIEEQIVKEKILQRDIKAVVLRGGLRKMTDVCCQEYIELCLSPEFDFTLAAKVSDISMRMYMAIYDKFVIVPTISKVRNWGFDGSGEFCLSTKIYDRNSAKQYPYHIQPIDDSCTFTLIEDLLCDNWANKGLMNNFDPITLRQKFKIFIKASMFIVFGKKIYTQLTQLFRKF